MQEPLADILANGKATAIAPRSAQASMNSTVSLDVTNRLASRPALLSLGSVIALPSPW